MDKLLKRIVWPIIIIPAVYLAIVWNRLPQAVALHFDLKGNPDRMGTKSELLTTSFILIVMNAIVYLIVTNIYRIDPKKYAAENKSRLLRIAFAVSLFMTAVLCMIIFNGSQGNITFSTGLLLSGMGLLFAIIGNYMPNLKPNYFTGIRLPWTLENEDNWRKTHFLAGRLWFGGGLILAVVCLFIPASPALILFFSVMSIVVIVPCIYSYQLYRKQKQLIKP